MCPSSSIIYLEKPEPTGDIICLHPAMQSSTWNYKTIFFLHIIGLFRIVLEKGNILLKILNIKFGVKKTSKLTNK